MIGKEVSDFLIEFSIGVHRYAMYPPDHPSLIPAADNVLARLEPLLAKRPLVSLGVARRQLVIDGIATADRNPVLIDLAKRLHGHQIGAITFGSDVTVAQLEGLLTTLALEAERSDDPIGLRAPETIPSWPDIRLVPVGYEDLGLAGPGDIQEGARESMELWLGLARAASAGQDGPEEGELPDAHVLADRINRHGREQAYDQVIVGYLHQLAEELSAEGKPSGPGTIRRQVSKLVSALDNPTLRRILDMGGDLDQRRRFVQRATKGMDTQAAMRILTAAGECTGQEISRQMVRMLGKLSRHAQVGNEPVRPLASQHLNQQVENLLRDWTLESPNPDSYVRVLDGLSTASPLFAPDEDMNEGSALALVQMALEVDSYGPMVEHAVSELMGKGQLPQVYPLIEGAQITETGRKIRSLIGNPQQIEALATLETLDPVSLELLIELVGPETAALPLLRTLIEAESRDTRRALFDALVGIGEPVVDYVPRFLDDERWYVLRNMLALVHALPRPPRGFSAERFIGHSDPRVRQEATAVALADPDLRVKALALGLRDADERVIRLSVADLASGVPEPVVPILVDRVLRSDEWPDQLIVPGIRALGRARSPQARMALVELVSMGRGFLGRHRIRPASREVLAGLRALRRTWSDHPDVKPILKAATRSRHLPTKRAAGARIR